MGLVDNEVPSDDDEKRSGSGFTCIICQMRLGRLSSGVRPHFLSAHGIELPPLNRIYNIGEMMSFLEVRIAPPPPISETSSETQPPQQEQLWFCPVCGEAVGTESTLLELHVGAAHHQQWNRHTINGFSSCYRANVVSSDTEDDDEEDNCGDEVDGIWEEVLPMTCLYCSYAGVDCLEHMQETHGFDLSTGTRGHAEVRDEYDLIRLVNAVRRSVKDSCCPYCGERHSGDLEVHLSENPGHRLPQHLPATDDALIPFLPEDALISHMMASEGGFLAAEESDPDFPMVPTVLQLAEMKRKSKQTKEEK